MKAKRILALLLAAMMVLALAACGNSGDKKQDATEAGKTDTKTAEGGSVYWLNFKPELDETLQDLAKKYTEAKGVEVKVVTAASGTYSTTLTAEMDKTEAPTLFVIGNQQGVKDWGDFALDLKDTAIAKELNTDAYNLYDENGKLVSIGYCYECYGIIVNPTLIEKAGHTMDEIKNFAGLKAVAEDIHSKAGELGFDAFSSSDMDDSSSWRFTGHLANLEYYYEEKEAGGWTECPASLTGKYMENYKNLYDLIINNSLTAPTDLATGGHDAEAEFKEGKAAFFVNGSWEYAAVSEAVPNATMIPYYCGVEGEEKAGLNCGTENCWAVNANASAADQQATIDFMVWLVSDPEASATMVGQLGIMPYKNAAASTNGFLNDAAKYTADGCYVMDWATNYQPNVDEYRKDLVSALNAYNADQTDANWDLVKTAFVDGWAKQYQTVNG
ncbi:ABC transporter substrate-binding protein [Ruminococcus sp.]|uniref:ABC transporter substrate-binding protein n=1 Tax=Ruminococcus sp. TaxID=41978 RepID=UPI002930C0AF|nr:ABC transporter substrate-binding protein [uncultured Ruminococcus sp.]